MNIIYCDYCLDIVDSSRDERRFKPHEDIDGEIICTDCADIKAHDEDGFYIIKERV
tara:strand:- start:1635 stop:1802 length:168 start_codon:yes stop_codon:yes gene_type:complete